MLATLNVTVFFTSSAFEYVTVWSPSVPERDNATISPTVVIVRDTSLFVMVSGMVVLVVLVVVFFFVVFELEELLLPPPPPPLEELLPESELDAALVLKLNVPDVLQFNNVSHDVTL